MRNKKILGLAAAGCIGVGAVLMGIGFAMGGEPGYFIDRTGVHASGDKQYSKPYELKKTKIDEFSSISIDLDYADLEIIPSDGYYLEYRIEGGSRKPEWNVKNQKLTFREIEQGYGSFVMFGGFSSIKQNEKKYEVKLYIPKDKKLSDVRINSDDGAVILPFITAQSFTAECDYGDLTMDGFKGGSFNADMDDGDLNVKSIDADRITVKNSYGDSTVDQMKAGAARLSLDDGSLYIGSSDVNDLRVENNYGDVEIVTAGSWEAYDLDLHTDYGSIILPDGRSSYREDGDEEEYRVNNGSDKMITVDCDDGNVEIKSGK